MNKPLVALAGDNPIEQGPMGRRQILVLLIAVLLAGLDGFDALSMAFVAPALAREWHLAKDVIGLLLASSLAGMALGAIALSPLADTVGRKKVVLGALAILVGGAALSASVRSVAMLMAVRLLTGVGIGVMVSMTTLISAEFSNTRRRPLAVAAVATLGFPLGGVLGGLAASAILKTANWQGVFFAGAVCGGVLFALAAVALPESPAFLMARGTPEGLARANRVLGSLGHGAVMRLPLVGDRPRGRYRALMAPEWRGTVLRLMLTAILIAVTSYYILNWLPEMVVDAGFTPSQGSWVSALSGMGGLFGGVSFAALVGRWPSNRVAGVAMAAAAVALSAVGLVPAQIGFLVAAGGVLSFCLAGTTGMLYAIMADAFPATLRGSGIGLVMGAARIFSAGGPAAAGIMFKHGMTRAEVSLIFALGPLCGAALIGTFRRP